MCCIYELLNEQIIIRIGMAQLQTLRSEPKIIHLLDGFFVFVIAPLQCKCSHRVQYKL